MVDGTGDDGPFIDYASAVASYPATPIADECIGTSMLYSSGTTGRPKGILRPLPDTPPSEPLMLYHFLLKLWQYRDGMVYLQATRGAAAERDFAFPKNVKPTLVMFTSVKDIINAPSAKTGIGVITVPDLRWTRRDIKSVALLAQVLAKQAAAEAGAGEAWMIEDGKVTEGGSSSAFILTQDDVLVTRENGSAILPGCTRKAVVRLAEERQLRIEERAFTVEEALAAKEAFITSATVFVQAVVSIDGKQVANGKPGPMTDRLREIYVEFAKATAT